MQFKFQTPEILYGLFLLLFLWVLLRIKYKANLKLFWKSSIPLFGLVSCLLGLARLQGGISQTSQTATGSNLYVAIDISNSMLSEDVLPSRIDFAREFCQKLALQLNTNSQGVRLALYPLSQHGNLLMPLTNDIFALEEMLAIVHPSLSTSNGTDLNEGLKQLFKLIIEDRSKANAQGADNLPTQVILLSDGESHQPVEKTTLRFFKKENIPITVVGIGTSAGSPIRIESRFGMKEILKDQTGNPVRSKLDIKTLKEIANSTNGNYFLGRFDELGALISKLSQSAQLLKLKTHFKVESEFFPLFFLFALLCFLFDYSQRRWAPLIRSFLILLTLFSPELMANESDADAIKKFNQATELSKEGNIQKAIELFQETALLSEDKALQKKALFNLGNAFVRAQDPNQALMAYQQAYEIQTNKESLNKEMNQKISENIVLATEKKEQMMKQQGEKPDDKEGEGNNPKDPNGPQKYSPELLSESQKKKIYDLLSGDEKETLKRYFQNKNKNKTFDDSKPW